MRQMYREIISLFFHKDVATRTEVEFLGAVLIFMIIRFMVSGVIERL